MKKWNTPCPNDLAFARRIVKAFNDDSKIILGGSAYCYSRQWIESYLQGHFRSDLDELGWSNLDPLEEANPRSVHHRLPEPPMGVFRSTTIVYYVY